jgi:hypothetical protein
MSDYFHEYPNFMRVLYNTSHLTESQLSFTCMNSWHILITLPFFLLYQKKAKYSIRRSYVESTVIILNNFTHTSTLLWLQLIAVTFHDNYYNFYRPFVRIGTITNSFHWSDNSLYQMEWISLWITDSTDLPPTSFRFARIWSLTGDFCTFNLKTTGTRYWRFSCLCF